MRSDTAARALFVTLLALSLYLMYLIFKPFLPGIAWAVVMVVAFQPVYERLVRLLGGRSWAAATLLSTAAAAIIVVPAVFAIVKVGQGLVEAYGWLEAQRSAGHSFIVEVQGLPWYGDLREWLGRYVDLSKVDLQDMILSTLQNLGNALVGKTRAFVTNLIEALLTLAVLLVTMAVLFHEAPRVLHVVRQFLPLSEPDKDAALAELRAVMRSVFFGVLLTALVQGLLGAIGFAIVGLPAPVMFGAAMFFCALLPFGTALVWVPAVLYLFATGESIRALILLVWSVALVSSADNLLRPIFIGRGLKLHTLLVFFGIFGGMIAFGLIGLFTGPLVITLFLFLLDVARRDLFRPAPAPPPV